MHLIDITTGIAACMVTGTPAWHRLGKVISSAATSAEAIKLAVLDWLVEQQPMYLANGNKVPGRVANVRSDTGAVLGVVGTGYKPFQNAEAFEFMDTLVGEKLAMFETAGAIRDGKTVWMLARIPKELRAAGEDVIHPYILLTNGHDGTRALRILPTTVRVVCNNTLNLALSDGANTGFTLNHSKRLAGRVEDAREKLGLICQRVDRFQEQINALAAVSLSETEVTGYFESLFPVKRQKPQVNTDGASLLDAVLAATEMDMENRRFVADLAEEITDRESKRNAEILELIVQNYHNERNNLPGISGTAWSAYNAVSEWADHQMTVRGKDERTQADNRLNSIWFGKADEIKQEAFSTAMDLVNARA